jgi:predicted Zn-dependent protease
MKLWSLGCVALGLLISGVVMRPVMAAPPALSDKDKHQMESESAQGATIAAQIAKEQKFDTDAADNARVSRIGQRIAAIANSTVVPAGYGNDHVYPFIWHFYIIKDKDVNAFSLPGGYVYINSGLLNFVRSDDELAGVLGHEITHAAHHHVQALSHEQSKMTSEAMIGMLAAIIAHVPMQDLANIYQGVSYTQMGVLNNKYSEAAESDADHGGTILMTKAGFNPVGMLTFMQRLGEQEKVSPNVELGILRDHPYTEDRVTAISAQLHEMDIAVTPRSIRQATDAPRVSVVPGSGMTVQIVFGSRTLATLVDPTGQRSAAAAAALNDLLDQGLQLYQVKSDGPNLVVADRTVLTFTSADSPPASGSDPQALATQASAVLRAGLWAQTVKQ